LFGGAPTQPKIDAQTNSESKDQYDAMMAQFVKIVGPAGIK